MDAQVQNAIEIAWNPTSDQNLKAQAFDFLNQLREDDSAWQVCLSIFGRTPRASEVVRHVALEIANHAVEKGQMGDQSLAFLKDNLMEYIRRIYGPRGNKEELDTITIQNKLTQTVTYLFKRLYATTWTSFFDDFLSLTVGEGSSASNNAPGVFLYLRVINSVHDEIADVLVPRTLEEQRKDNDLKDLVRERDVEKVVRSWQQILTEWQERDAGAVDLCLRAIGRWVNWIDISLVVNEDLLNILFQLVGYARTVSSNLAEDNVRDAAIDTFTEIVGKKMKPADKINMIVYLNVGNVITQLIASPPLHDLRATSNYDTDLAEAVARLANSTAFDIIKALDSDSLDGQASQQANELLQTFLPYVLRFFSDEYDEICSTVIPSLTDLLTFLRKEAKTKGALAPEFAAMLSPILNAIIVKTKYDETSSWGSEDEQTDEAEFQELRKRLQILQQAVAAVDETLYIDMISNVVGTTFENYQRGNGQLNWRDLDLALHEMFLFGDLVVRSGGLYSKTKPISTAAERLVGMMLKMVESDIASFQHPAIQLQYMEICVRYCSFFEHHTSFVPRVLENFVRLIHHNHIKVRTRSWYLFHRFTKHLRAQIGNVVQTVIEAVSDLLPIRAELPQEGSEEENMSSDENDQSADATFSSQLYLYEAIGCICSTSAVPVDKQVLYVRSVLNPLFTDLEAHLDPARNGDERAKLQIHHVIMALGTLARGFSDWSPGNTSSSSSGPANEVSEEFTRAAEAILVALESLNSSSEIRTAARFTFSRLVGVLGARILAQLPRWIDGLLSQSSTKDEMAMFLRLLDQVVYGFKTEIFQILDTLLTPLLQRVFVGISEPTTGTDDEIQLAELKREFLNFLLIILNNELASVLVSTTNQHIFENVISLIELFVKDITDYPTAKLAFSILIRMSMVWGGPDTTPLSLNSSPPPPSKPPSEAALPGFDRFMLTRFSPLCWVLPTTPGFNAKDAQAKQVLAEAASLQKTIYSKRGQEYLTWLRDVELRGMGMAEGTAEEYLRALSSLDLKGFRQFFQAFVQRSGG